MKKSDVVRVLLGDRLQHGAVKAAGRAFAPTNIALCKYWGKRNQELNLPFTSSLSISLGNKGATVAMTVHDAVQDVVILNGAPVATEAGFYQRLVHFLDLFRQTASWRLRVDVQSNIPIAAGLASSACGFASLAMALDDLFDWQLDARALSILARLGSGSASRSITPGFVEWQAGVREDGMDSYGVVLPAVWPELCVGLLIMNDKEKGLSSREAMQRTVETSQLYTAWPAQVQRDLRVLKEALTTKDFTLLGETAESNAMAMHATLLSAWPAITYAVPETLLAMQKIWQLRQQGLALYFTQDAGPNLKLLFAQRDREAVQALFPAAEILQPSA